MKLSSIALPAVAFTLALGALIGCSTESSDEFYRDVSVNFTGIYTPNNGDKIVGNNSGKAITRLDLRQTGDSLQAIDNNGSIWRGSIGEVIDSSATFDMEGTTTAGNEGTFSGNLVKSGDTSATMSGTWIEPDRYSTFSASGSISPTPTNSPDPGTNTPTNVTLRLDTTTWPEALAGAAHRLWFLSGQTGFEELDS